jgi:class 3 adenylate cyclase/pimeloyl-ACP methyl ester carboxylesterase
VAVDVVHLSFATSRLGVWLMEVPDPRYVRATDGAYIAYQVVGDGAVDVAWQVDAGGCLDVWWELGWARAWFEGLASFARLILHDWRATGLSSRNVPVPNLETRAEDLRLVLDAAGSRSAVLGGWWESLGPCVLLAAREPARVRALLWWNPLPRTARAPDYPWGQGPGDIALERAAVKHWGTIEHARAWAQQVSEGFGGPIPDEAVKWWVKKCRNTCTPDVAAELDEIWWETDVRGILPAVQVPTLLMVDDGDGGSRPEAEHVASLMPSVARVQALPAMRGWPTGRAEIQRIIDPRLDAVQRFIGVEPPQPAFDTVLSTVLFTDIVGSTKQQARLGDRGWKAVVEQHHATVRNALGSWRGVENDTAGDGFYATFDGPARAIHCAHEIRDGVRDLGIEVRAGIHTGECELVDGKCAGIAVTTGARIAARARPSQVLVSQTVKDLVAGSGFRFESVGEHELSGVPDTWRLYDAR